MAQLSSLPGGPNGVDANGNLFVPPGGQIGRYTVGSILGRGSYGIVYAASSPAVAGTLGLYDVALKVVRNRPAYRRQALLEVQTLQDLRQRYQSDARYAQIVDLRDAFEYRGHVCLAFERLSHTLHAEAYSLTRRGRGASLWSIDRIRHVVRQVLQALSLLEGIGTIHCDVKPENVMYRTESGARMPPRPIGSPSEEDDTGEICLIDFGAVRSVSDNDYFDVQSLWYRAPEVLQKKPYSAKIDVWSVGCMAAELYVRSPLFPGLSTADQMRRIYAVSRPEGIATYLSAHLCYDWGSSTTLQCAFIDFVTQCLQLDPSRRPSASEALQHTLFSMVRVRSAPVVPWLYEDSKWSPGDDVIGVESDGDSWERAGGECGISVDESVESSPYFGTTTVV